MFEEDDALASKAASKEDNNSAGLEGGTRSCGVDGFTGLVGVDVSIEFKHRRDSEPAIR